MTTMWEDMNETVVLLAEDNPAEQALARRALMTGGVVCDLRIVSDGEETLDYLHRRRSYADPKTSPPPISFCWTLTCQRSMEGRS